MQSFLLLTLSLSAACDWKSNDLTSTWQTRQPFPNWS